MNSFELAIGEGYGVKSRLTSFQTCVISVSGFNPSIQALLLHIYTILSSGIVIELYGQN